MCGIVGILAFDGTPVDPIVLDRMNNRQVHRGPDGAGYLFAWRANGGFTAQTLQPLFKLVEGNAGYDISPDGSRILVAEPTLTPTRGR